MLFNFKGGIYPDVKKAVTHKKAIEEADAPKEIILPLIQHKGSICNPIVSVGDHVKLGQRVAEGDPSDSAPIHSSVSGRVVAIEPLNYSECNIVNTVADSMRVVKAVNKPNVFTLIDFYHVRYNGEDIESFVDYKGYIKHVHVASFNNHRRYPRPFDGEDFRGFFDVLRRADYKESNVSIEAGLIDQSIITFKNTAMSAYNILKNI